MTPRANRPTCVDAWMQGSLFAKWIFSYTRGHVPSPTLASRFFLALWLNPRFDGETMPGKAVKLVCPFT